MSEAPDTSPTPAVGEPLPRGAEAFGVRYKLEMYSLDVTHKHGGPKARGFELILGITIDAIDYLEGAIQTGVLLSPVTEVRENPPWGIKCAVIVTYRSQIGQRAGREERPRHRRHDRLAVRRTIRPAATCIRLPEALEWRNHGHTRQAGDRRNRRRRLHQGDR
jgi:hypothetical protein